MAVTQTPSSFARRSKQRLNQMKSELAVACQSKEDFEAFVRTKDSESSAKWSWVNEDLLPTATEKRTWGPWNYAFFYSSLAMDSWTLGSGLIGIGLLWWEAIIVCFVAQSIGSMASALNARGSATYHLGFPSVARSVFGMYGAYYAVFARAALAVIYFSAKIYTGSSFVVNMLHAVFGRGFTSIPNHIPKSVGFTTAQFLAFFLFWLVHIPFVFLRPNQYRWLFTCKMAVMIPTIFGLFIFCMVNTGADLGLDKFKAERSMSAGWLVMSGLNSGLGTHSTLVTNQPDFSRWSRSKKDSIWTLVFYPFAATLSASLGILSTSAINSSWGLKLWNPWDLLTAILERYPHPSARFAVFLCAFCWALLTLGTNIAANMIAFGSDCSMLLPQYFNIPRGQVLALLLAWPLFPWKIFSSAKTFNNFLSGYGMFMGGLSGVMIIEYWFWSRGNIFTQFLYHPGRSNSHYNYTRGWNLAAFAAYIAGFVIPLPGFVGRLGVTAVSPTAGKLYNLGWLLSFFVSMAVYSLICFFFPTENQKRIKELGLTSEQLEIVGNFDAEVYRTSNGTIIGRELENDDVSQYIVDDKAGAEV